MNQPEWKPEDIERIANMTGLPPEVHAMHQRDAKEQRNRSHEDWDEFQKGYRAFFEGKPKGYGDSASTRGWECAMNEDDDD